MGALAHPDEWQDAARSGRPAGGQNSTASRSYRIARTGAWRGQIEAVRIAALLRSFGVGRQMFEWALSECRSRGGKIVQLTTDKGRLDAHRFYEKLGFIASHEGYKLVL